MCKLEHFWSGCVWMSALAEEGFSMSRFVADYFPCVIYEFEIKEFKL